MAKMTPRQLKQAAQRFIAWREDKLQERKDRQGARMRKVSAAVWDRGQHNAGTTGASALRSVDTMMKSPLAQHELLRDTRGYYE